MSQPQRLIVVTALAALCVSGCAVVPLFDVQLGIAAPKKTKPSVSPTSPTAIKKPGVVKPSKKKKRTKKKRGATLKRRPSKKIKGTPPSNPPKDPPKEDPPKEELPRRIMTQAEATALLATHNSARSAVGVGPLQWSDTIASYAQEWANTLQDDGCPVQHRPNRPYGENIYWRSYAGSTAAVVEAWTAESVNYNHADNSCSQGICGHYTQVVWANTQRLGCGVASCDSKEVWVCNYDPPGNYSGQSPY